MPLLYLLVGFVLGAIVVGACWRMTDEGTPEIVNDVTINYMYEAEPGGASGNNAMPVESVQFHPGYVVVTDTNGGGMLFAVNRLRSFSYQPTAKP